MENYNLTYQVTQLVRFIRDNKLHGDIEAFAKENSVSRDTIERDLNENNYSYSNMRVERLIKMKVLLVNRQNRLENA